MNGPDGIGAAPQAGPGSAASAGSRKAAEAFEGYLLGAILRQATRPLSGRPALLDGGSAGRTFREMFLDEIARVAAARGDLGVARLLEADPELRAGEGTR